MSTQNIPFSIYKKKTTLNYPLSAAMGFFKGTQTGTDWKQSLFLFQNQFLYRVEQDGNQLGQIF